MNDIYEQTKKTIERTCKKHLATLKETKKLLPLAFEVEEKFPKIKPKLDLQYYVNPKVSISFHINHVDDMKPILKFLAENGQHQITERSEQSAVLYWKFTKYDIFAHFNFGSACHFVEVSRNSYPIYKVVCDEKENS